VTLTGWVYGLRTTDTRILYVGSTGIPLRSRLDNHLNHSRNGGLTPVHAWIREVGAENVVIELLEEVYDGPLAEREDHWAVELATEAADGGLNHRIGTRWARGNRRWQAESA
jgi:hypothetical protein